MKASEQAWVLGCEENGCPLPLPRPDCDECWVRGYPARIAAMERVVEAARVRAGQCPWRNEGNCAQCTNELCTTLAALDQESDA